MEAMMQDAYIIILGGIFFLNKNLKVIFLGGVGEIGKNMTVLEYEDDIIVIDAGLTFPNDEMPGIDHVIPDIAYLNANKSKIRGIVLTHGHEDHIGALPYVLKDIKVPVYGTRLTLALLEHKLKEHIIENVDLKSVKPRSIIKLGCFTVEFIKVCHSVAGSCALSITTPTGVVFHTGDFKIDHTPIDGEVTDLNRIAEIGRRGVLLLLAESTNVERQGSTMSEATVGRALDNILAEEKDKRIIVATFASNIHRLQQILDLAVKHKRKVAFSGRSMLNVVEVSSKIGELKYDKNLIVEIDKVSKIADKDLLIISTGSQGEPMSALTRMASGDFNKITIGINDTIIISASPIPGNEKDVYKVINNLYRKGANVIYDSLAEVHVSGHACVEELKLIHRLLSPQFFIPVHGEYRHLIKHAKLAASLGMPKDSILIPDLGNSVEVSKTGIKIKGNVPAGHVLVDGLGIGDVGSVVLRDRIHLSEDGLIVVVVAVDMTSGEITSGPELISRGFMYIKEGDTLVEEAKNAVLSSISGFEIKSNADVGELKNQIRKDLRYLLFKKTKRNPMILPIILEG
jgi:ribonuclease J